jgi:hypothetical protein
MLMKTNKLSLNPTPIAGIEGQVPALSLGKSWVPSASLLARVLMIFHLIIGPE